MPLILGTNSIKDTGYEVANSLRFNDGSTDYLNKTFSSAGNRKTFTFSLWLKRSALNSSGNFGLTRWNASDSERANLQFQNDSLLIQMISGGSFQYNSGATTRIFRDVSAWYHIVLAVDTTDGTQANRVKLYVNGVQETLSPSTNISQNTDTNFNNSGLCQVGAGYGDSAVINPYDGYMAEVVFIDGQALDPTSFGEFDEDSPTIWKPKDVSGLTFGTNGFYLDFENSSSLGADVSGNSNNFTVNNLTSADQSTDTCTNNYAVLNILDNAQSDATYSEGNLKWQTTTNSHYFWGRSTIGVSTGKWYFEAKLTSAMEHGYIGICVSEPDDNTTFLTNGGTNDEFEWGYKLSDGRIYNNTGDSAYGSTYTTGDIIGVYLDLDNNKLYFAKNGTIQNSGTGISITSPASTSTGNYFFCISDGTSGTSGTWEVNFGGTSTYTISSGNTDGEYGNFEYSTTITGDGASKTFKALNTKNLAEFG